MADVGERAVESGSGGDGDGGAGASADEGGASRGDMALRNNPTKQHVKITMWRQVNLRDKCLR